MILSTPAASTKNRKGSPLGGPFFVFSGGTKSFLDDEAVFSKCLECRDL